MKRKNNNVVFIVSDEKGFGMHPSYGGMITPCIFASEDAAKDYIISVGVKFPEIKLNIYSRTGAQIIGI